MTVVSVFPTVAKLSAETRDETSIFRSRNRTGGSAQLSNQDAKQYKIPAVRKSWSMISPLLVLLLLCEYLDRCQAKAIDETTVDRGIVNQATLKLSVDIFLVILNRKPSRLTNRIVVNSSSSWILAFPNVDASKTRIVHCVQAKEMIRKSRLLSVPRAAAWVDSETEEKSLSFSLL